MKINDCSKCGNEAKLKHLFGEITPRHYFVKCSSCINVSSYSFIENNAIENWNKENPIEEIKFISQEDINKIKIIKNKDLTNKFLQKLSNQIKALAEKGYKDAVYTFKKDEEKIYDWNIIYDTLENNGFNNFKLVKGQINYVLYIGWN